VALSLGAQDLFKNLIAGFLILAEKRFAVGDWIKVGGVVEGTVEQINFRSTIVRQFDKGPIQVPNTLLADNPLANFSRRNNRRINWKIGLVYETSVDQLREVRDRIYDYLTTSEAVLQPPEGTVLVQITGFGDSSIDMLIYCFAKTTDWAESMAFKQELTLAIKEIVADVGSDFAYPTRTLHVEGPGLAETVSQTNHPKITE
jgi:MscS family membrane protein